MTLWPVIYDNSASAQPGSPTVQTASFPSAAERLGRRNFKTRRSVLHSAFRSVPAASGGRSCDRVGFTGAFTRRKTIWRADKR